MIVPRVAVYTADKKHLSLISEAQISVRAIEDFSELLELIRDEEDSFDAILLEADAQSDARLQLCTDITSTPLTATIPLVVIIPNRDAGVHLRTFISLGACLSVSAPQTTEDAENLWLHLAGLTKLRARQNKSRELTSGELVSTQLLVESAPYPSFLLTNNSLESWNTLLVKLLGSSDGKELQKLLSPLFNEIQTTIKNTPPELSKVALQRVPQKTVLSRATGETIEVWLRVKQIAPHSMLIALSDRNLFYLLKQGKELTTRYAHLLTEFFTREFFKIHNLAENHTQSMQPASTLLTHLLELLDTALGESFSVKVLQTQELSHATIPVSHVKLIIRSLLSLLQLCSGVGELSIKVTTEGVQLSLLSTCTESIVTPPTIEDSFEISAEVVRALIPAECLITKSQGRRIEIVIPLK